MKKLKLALDDLAVETFDTTPAAREKGTVVGEQEPCTCPTQCTCPTCPTCCNTCEATCPYTCDDNTCANTCENTCDDFTCIYTCGFSNCETRCGPAATCRCQGY